MNNAISEETERCIREASEWIARHGSDDPMSPAEVRRWQAWASDPVNLSMYDKISQSVLDVRSLPPPRAPSVAELLADSEPVQTIIRENAEEPATRWGTSRSRKAWLSLAAAVLIVCIGYGALQLLRSVPHVGINPAQAYETGPGEERTVQLEEGSSVTLGGASALKVRFSRQQRTVALVRGEALFRVASDAERPFRVFAANGSITAIGTEFNVRCYSKRVIVTVAQGVVDVGPREVTKDETAGEDMLLDHNAQWVPVRVTHGHEMTYDAKGDASAARPTDVRAALAWTQGRLIYNGQSLREVVEDVERNSHRRIEIDPAAGELQYAGMIKQEDLDEWFQLLPKVFPVEVIERANAPILIRLRVAPTERRP